MCPEVFERGEILFAVFLLSAFSLLLLVLLILLVVFALILVALILIVFTILHDNRLLSYLLSTELFWL